MYYYLCILVCRRKRVVANQGVQINSQVREMGERENQKGNNNDTS
jgi:hypothetical protein